MADDDRYYIDPSQKDESMIALTCVHHPDLRWHTKNIAPIGCRSIFYNLWSVPGAPRECDCPLRDLRPLKESTHA